MKKIECKNTNTWESKTKHQKQMDYRFTFTNQFLQCKQEYTWIYKDRQICFNCLLETKIKDWSHQMTLPISTLEMVVINCGKNVPFVYKKLKAIPTTQKQLFGIYQMH